MKLIVVNLIVIFFLKPIYIYIYIPEMEKKKKFNISYISTIYESSIWKQIRRLFGICHKFTIKWWHDDIVFKSEKVNFRTRIRIKCNCTNYNKTLDINTTSPNKLDITITKRWSKHWTWNGFPVKIGRQR